MTTVVRGPARSQVKSRQVREGNPYLGIDCNDVGTNDMREQVGEGGVLAGWLAGGLRHGGLSVRAGELGIAWY